MVSGPTWLFWPLPGTIQAQRGLQASRPGVLCARLAGVAEVGTFSPGHTDFPGPTALPAHLCHQLQLMSLFRKTTVPLAVPQRNRLCLLKKALKKGGAPEEYRAFLALRGEGPSLGATTSPPCS